MATANEGRFPGGSRSRVTRAGERVRTNTAGPEDFAVIEEWRAAHRGVLNTFQAMLRNRTRDQNIIVAQRHKRKSTIFDKLQRFPEMQLGRMDDVAGCRLIFRSLNALSEFRARFHRARFNHRLRNQAERYNYVANPKATGYRGIHDVYEYHVNSEAGRDLAGLNIEIQYRTLVQHAWATAVELVGSVTRNEPKFERGDDRYTNAMALASELLARGHEQSSGPFPLLTDREVLDQFLALDADLALVEMFRELNGFNGNVDRRNSILISSPKGDLEILNFRHATDALRSLFELEREKPGYDIVLVRADTAAEVKLAFRNYFGDAREFVLLLESACEKLSGRKIPQMRRIRI